MSTVSITSGDVSLQHLSFIVAGEQYAIELLKVREILRYENITRVPRMPEAVRGVINVRGNVVPVVDLAIKFGLDATEVTKRTCIIILEVVTDGEESVMGVLADAVEDVISLAPDEIKPPPAFGTRVRLDFLTGMGHTSHGFILILDIDKVLSAAELHMSAAAVDDEPDDEASDDEDAAEDSDQDSSALADTADEA